MHGRAKMPVKASRDAAGWDVYATDEHIIPGGQWRKINLGIGLEMPPNLCAVLMKRSGMASKYGVMGQEGLIDSDYRGILGMTVVNLNPRPYRVKAGDRVGQLLFLPALTVKLEQVAELQPTTRGTKGFGSTGR